jgi:NAD(P)-dependent dehydrogenase (short-subunit alcohol dehydrogenase family)
MIEVGDKRLVVVTGATGGIGWATAMKLHEDGYAIVAHCGTRFSRAVTLSDQIRNQGGFCVPIMADLSTAAGIRDLVDFVLQTLDDHQLQLHGLVNNAALLLGPAFADASPEQFDRYFALNTRAPFFLTQGLAARFVHGGSVVSISSAGAHFSSPGDIVYAMSKSALESFTVHAAEALARLGVRINTVIPGFTDNGHPAFLDPSIKSYLSGFSALGDVAKPESVADAVAFLISDRSKRTTGSTIDVSGGSMLGVRASGGVSLRAVAGGSSEH